MLIEFSNADSKQMRDGPYTLISESYDQNIISKYITVKNFLIVALDSVDFNLKNGGSYILIIENVTEDKITTTSTNMQIPTFKFNFKFNSLEKVDTKNSTIHGSVELSIFDEILSFKRTARKIDDIPVQTIPNDTSAISARVCCNDQNITTCNTSAWTYYQQAAQKAAESSSPFDSGDQHSENNLPAGRQEESNGNNDASTIELSSNSFSVKNESITIEDPSLNIGKIDDRSFVIDAERQARQDEFLKKMNAKFIKRKGNN